MNQESVMTLAHQAMYIGLLLAAPLLLVALVVGLVVSLFQAATQINETTLSFIPKLLAIAITMVIAGPWMLTIMLDYLRETLTNIPSLVN
ncbi:flagellar biosynthesis protein FliQ [Paraburkholderia sp. RP-4-7]|jgi:flagellar biosynthetic protein FliQ|uniref:Flagellar biosynthetic protein FliQ n=1 Tax=Paraburkholderia polaris TaxID=2728848 RepID=A0A848IJV0_9BURK|nr:flagellar biosynthesis protein FliQ [Paraburkholderia polaris]NML99973.1 flagellar biosynthesis protein FliQ [Paraburkholderia polaris]